MKSRWIPLPVILVAFCATVPALALGMNGESSDELAKVREAVSASSLLPHAVIDKIEWNGGIASVYITLAESARSVQLDDLQIEGFSAMIAGALHGNDEIAGVRVRIRLSKSSDYGTLEQLRLSPTAQEVEHKWRKGPDLSEDIALTSGLRTTVTNAARQPIGALTGVTVYASAGHGWTAYSTAWELQRPVLWEMAEDYGNIDQLNYFAQYAFNAGATVVPLRPVGWQPIEIVIDNDDAAVTYTGTWSTSTSTKHYEGSYASGVSYRYATTSPTETAVARYTPTITETGFYPVYCFALASTNRALQTYRIGHSGGISEVAVDHREVGNGWVYLGEYHLEAGGSNYVEITNKSTDGDNVIADAIRWGCGAGDISRPGPGSISGFTRDEEAQRYWAHSELGNNASGFDSSIWNGSGDDGSDNVRTGAKVAREMNQVPAGGVQVDRWKRVHLEFHTNAHTGSARGQICLITDLGATTYQTEYATILSNEVDADMAIMDDTFEHSWVDRTSATVTSSYGAICTPANSNEFDATIVELAFHDNETDAQLLRDPRVRSAMARSCVHGIIKFLNTLPGSEIPLAFAPDTPRNVRATDAGNGNITLSWEAPLSDGARGDAATGYVVYTSENGYGFGSPIVLGNVLTTTISGVPTEETHYFRISATNSGGESMPSEVLAVRRPASGTANTVIVNGFDRLRRDQTPVQVFTQPAAYAGDSLERAMWRKSNSSDYVVQYAEALAATTIGFVTCANEAIIDDQVDLTDYDIALWILGMESTEDSTFDDTEQDKVTEFLEGGGGLFVSGSQIGYDLINQGNGSSFMTDMLKTGFVSGDAGTTQASGSGGIFSDIGTFSFSTASGSPYRVDSPDRLSTLDTAEAVFAYSGGAGGIAGVQYDFCAYRTVVLGFPFEAISSSSTRTAVMQRVIAYLESIPGAVPFDYLSLDGGLNYGPDCDVDLDDYALFGFCFNGPENPHASGSDCSHMDGDGDGDVDLDDFALFQKVFTGPR